MSTAIIVSDVHLGLGSASNATAFHSFLDRVPQSGDHVVLNGDLFEFWFEYRYVIPREAFPTLERLAAVRARGCALTLMGGNHDRWGGPFWEEQLGAAFHPRGAELDLTGFRAWVHHGDGLTEPSWTSRVFHRVVTHPLTVSVFRVVHPDLGFAVVRRLAPRLAGRHQEPAERERAAAAQATIARQRLKRDARLDLVVLGHTHRPALQELESRRWYVNPGAWVDGCRYAVVTQDGPELKVYDPQSETG